MALTSPEPIPSRGRVGVPPSEDVAVAERRRAGAEHVRRVQRAVGVQRGPVGVDRRAGGRVPGVVPDRDRAVVRRRGVYVVTQELREQGVRAASSRIPDRGCAPAPTTGRYAVSPAAIGTASGVAQDCPAFQVSISCSWLRPWRSAQVMNISSVAPAPVGRPFAMSTFGPPARSTRAPAIPSITGRPATGSKTPGSTTGATRTGPDQCAPPSVERYIIW